MNFGTLSDASLNRKTNQPLDLATHLHQTRMFSSLSDQQIESLASHTSVRRINDKAPISLPSIESPLVHFLISGRAKVCYLTGDSKQPILYFVNPDELIGEQSILHGRLGEDYVEAIEPSLVANMPTRILREFMLNEPAFATTLLELICRRRMLVERRIRHTMFLSNRERLTHLLLDLADQYGEQNQDQLDLAIKLSHQDLANFIGSTRETVTVVLGKMQNEGLLSIRRRRITICKLATLAESVNRSTRG